MVNIFCRGAEPVLHKFFTNFMICKDFTGIMILYEDFLILYPERMRSRSMPREDRRIFFDYEETYKAIYSFCTQKGLPKPPAGYIMRIEQDLENPLELDIFIESSRSGSLEAVKYTKDFIAAALIIMCRTLGIPLPKGASKTLELQKDKIVLRVQMLR